MNAKGLISTIQGYSTKDGPGIRSTLFCIGCNLRCAWCSNPELMLPGIKCMKFGEEEEYVGYEISSQELGKRLLRDQVFYETSGGGVTFSGGEAALQKEFILETVGFLKEHGIHTALDTAGHIPWNDLNELADAVDMVLYDIKAFDKELHLRSTGVDNELILSNCKKIAAMKKQLIIRMVIVPEWNDDFEDIKKRIQFVKELNDPNLRLDLLAYHNLGEGKYKRLNLPYSVSRNVRLPEGYMEQIKALAVSAGIDAYILE